MTRIDLVPVEELSDQHLLSNHREIKRIPNMILKGKYNLNNIPKKFTLGKGHVKFFYNKLLWLQGRYNELYTECLYRHFKVTNFSQTFVELQETKPELFCFWQSSEDDIELSRARIAEKIYQKDICQQNNFYKWSKH